MLSTTAAVLQLNTLRKNLKREKRELEAIQNRKLRILLDHAYRNVSYYRTLFDDIEVKPSDIKGVDDIRRIPLTSKKKLQSLPINVITAKNIDLKKCVKELTSGSTGIPLSIYYTKKDYFIRSLTFIRTFMEFGYKLRDRQALVCDTRFVPLKKPWYQSFGIFRKDYIPVQSDLEEQIKILTAKKPDLIHGYPQSLAIIADEIISRGIECSTPKIIVSGAELLGRKAASKIETAFNSVLIDTYATIECGIIAWQCKKRNGYHINIDHVVLETLNDGKPALPGEPGKVFVTNLDCYAMPIIRYELGDVCTLLSQSCTCGNQMPLMGLVEGRIDDMVITPSGRIVSPNSITNVMEAVEGISQFRVIQESEDLLLTLIVKGRGFSEETPKITEQFLKELVGEEMTLGIQIVNDIPKEQTGKIRAVVSKLSKRQ